MPPLTIRASMLPAYADCARRTAAKQYRRIIQDAGFELRDSPPSVGAALGTAVHAAVEHVLREKLATGEPGRLDRGVEVAMGRFREEIEPGVEWDDTTPNRTVAEFQIARMAGAYMPLVAERQPAGVELALRATLAPGWEVSGHVDLYEGAPAVPGPDDLKTGAVRRPYQAQLGCYSLLLKSAGKPVERVGITFIPRSRKTKPQAAPERQEYDLATCEQAAWSTIQDIQRDVVKFRESGDPFAFRANPMSLMCSARYCPAHGTKFCRLHLPAPAAATDVD